ncbi:MAG: nucleic acid-binding protein [Treponema sp.]|nr:nucleic acid-binding protein [Treponema sp.]MBR7080377.1 nucleic acid-binding protein [Treponema sp.]
MQMSETLAKLQNLQDVLGEKYAIKSNVDELPKTLNGSRESLERFKKEYIEKNTEYEAEKEKVASLKADLEDAERTREKCEKEMDETSTHREYEILDKQISEATDKENSIRKELQREEKNLAELKDILESTEALISSTEAEYNELNESLEKELSGKKKRLAELEEMEAKMSEGIDPETVFKFQRIIQRNKEGIVAVRGSVCNGCHMILPAQFADEVHRGEKILFCPYCSRILYYEEAEENEESYIPTEVAGSLAGEDETDSPDFIESEDGVSMDEKTMDFDE